MIVAFGLQAICLIGVLTLGRTSATLFTLMMVLTFFTWGEVFSLFPATLGDYFGTKNATSNYGLLYSAKGVAAIIGVGVGTAIYERFNSWDCGFLWQRCAGACFVDSGSSPENAVLAAAPGCRHG